MFFLLKEVVRERGWREDTGWGSVGTRGEGAERCDKIRMQRIGKSSNRERVGRSGEGGWYLE